MADIHDEKIVMWRVEYLEELENFCFDNILAAAPRKLRPSLWTGVLSFAIVSAFVSSYCLRSIHPWFSGMLGNVAAGLIASVFILLFTTHKEKNVTFYDKLLFDLSKLSRQIDIAYYNVYNLHHNLTRARSFHTLNEYDYFATKAYMFQSTLIDIYENVKKSDKLGYMKFNITADQLEKQKDGLLAFTNRVALAASENGDKCFVDFNQFEEEYGKFWNIEHEIKRELNDYVLFVRDSEMIMKYGKTGT